MEYYIIIHVFLYNLDDYTRGMLIIRVMLDNQIFISPLSDLTY